MQLNLVHTPSFALALGLCLAAAAEAAPQQAALPGTADELDAVEAALAREDSASDDWSTEGLAARGQAELERWLAAAGDGSSAQDEPLAAAGGALTVSGLLPDELVWESLGPVSRLATEGKEAPAIEQLSPAELVDQLRGWLGLAGQGGEAAHLHVERVRAAAEGWELEIHVERQGPGAGVHAHWRAVFQPRGDASEGAELLELHVSELSAVRAPKVLFEDDTASAFAGPVLDEQLNLGIDAWRRRVDPALGMGLLGHHGMAIGDVNGDGLEDVYLCQPGGLPNRLYLGGGGAQPAREVAAQAGVDLLDSSTSALLLDLDGDGDDELLVTLQDHVLLFANLGRGRFAEAARFDAPSGTSMAAADTDLDGDVDLFVCGYLSPYDGSATPLPYHDARNGQANLFFRNDGELRFVEASAEVGLDAEGRRFSFAAAFEDMDLDGDPDLYVANDFGGNALYRNEGGRFTEVADEYGVRDISAGMGVTWSDFNGDGWPDLYVSNMHSSAGGRLAYQDRFQSEASADTRGQFQRHARGNSLFLSVEGQGFRDASASSGASNGGWAWGGLAVDMDLDGRDDLVVPNGFVSGAGDGPDL